MRLIARLIARIRRDERGVSMLVALGAMTITLGITAGTFTVMNAEVHQTQNDLEQKKALEAAQAGLQWYSFKLTGNVNYWNGCPTQTKMAVPGTTDEQFSFHELPASGQSACDPNNALTTEIEPTTSASPDTFRVQFDGYAIDPHYSSDAPLERTIVATFHRQGFLNYAYFTKYETSPYFSNPALTDCNANYYSRGNDCPVISFQGSDAINGPLHTNDYMQVCGSPTFGRAGHTPTDTVEAKGAVTCNGATPTYNNGLGGPDTTTPDKNPPPDNSQLKQMAGLTYTGVTTIVLHGSQMDVTNNGVTTNNVNFPANGVLYIANGNCGDVYVPYNPSYPGSSGCGNAIVRTSSNYTASLTIAAEHDIIINGNIQTTESGNLPTGSALLGLIANDWVRIYHPVSGDRGSTSYSCGSNTNQSGTMTNVTIDAAILAVNDSFIVDNYDCGAVLGTLRINGALAQIWRGAVGTGSPSGYTKSYNYDDRLLAQEPPFFINPVQADWQVARETECSAVGNASCSN